MNYYLLLIDLEHSIILNASKSLLRPFILLAEIDFHADILVKHVQHQAGLPPKSARKKLPLDTTLQPLLHHGL